MKNSFNIPILKSLQRSFLLLNNCFPTFEKCFSFLHLQKKERLTGCHFNYILLLLIKLDESALCFQLSLVTKF